jgi:organic hydroperoxide reductase OsmC/OhrA
MRISAGVQSSRGQNYITLATNDQAHSIQIAPKATGFGSTANGGELLFLALATCYCNDIYREAAKRGVSVERVEVEVTGEFGAEGEPTRNVTYTAKVWAHAPDQTIRDLMSHTDRVAEIQNTLRTGAAVTLGRAEAVTV